MTQADSPETGSLEAGPSEADAPGPTPGRAPLSRARVLAAAVGLADREGLEALSMRRLAQALRVEAMSLYNHVANKDDLLDGMVDLVIGEIQVPSLENADWREAMRRRAHSAHAVLLRHPWATVLVVSRVNVGPAMLRYVDATIGCLRAAGFPLPLVDHAWNAIDNHIYGFTLQALNFPFEPSEYAQAAAGFIDRIPEATHPHLHAMTRLVMEGKHDGVSDFAFGLDLILDGLARLCPGG